MRKAQIRLYVFYLGIFLTIIGLPFSRAMISFGQVILASLFLFDTNLLNKLKVIIRDKAALGFISIYFFWAIGLMYSSDIAFGLADLRTKIPLLIFPFVFATEPILSKKAFTNLALLFATTVVASMATSIYIYYTNDLLNFREAFPFVSHIRLSLMSLIAISIYMFFAFDDKYYFPKSIISLMLLACLFLIFAMFSLSLLSGIFIFIVILLVFITSLILKKISLRTILYGFTTIIMALIFLNFGIIKTIKDYNNVSNINLEKLDEYSAQGNKYEHNSQGFQIENGSYIGIYLQWDEMEIEWNKVSEMDFMGTDTRKQEIRYTLMRYLNSLNLRKDAEGVKKLSSHDISNIECGIANVEYAKKFSIKKRIYKLIWQYNIFKSSNLEMINGHTLLQRLELWRIGWKIIKNNPIIGVGTGDVNDAFINKMVQEKSPMAHMGLRSHNQYVSAFVSIGIVGLLAFLFSIIYPATVTKSWAMPLFYYFFIILFLSMFWEDTIESQVGVTIYAFIYMFYIYSPLNKQNKIEEIDL